jgi:HAD superfamily hydrolase (TIGR01490 family)
VADPTSARASAEGAAAARASLEGAEPDPATRVVAVFDLDNTIIRGASAFHLAVGLRRRGFVSGRDLLAFSWQQTRYVLFGENLQDIESARSRALSLVAGRSVAEVTAIGEEVWDEVLSLRIFPGTQEILDEHLRRGHEVWIISGSPVEIGTLIGRRLGVTGALGTVAEHKDGFYTGRLVGDMMHGEAKARAVRELAERKRLDLDESYAYGDSLHDTAILSSVGHPFAINPDLRLRRHARREGWPVHEFRGRRRRATRRGVQTASIGGLLWVASLVARAARRALQS